MTHAAAPGELIILARHNKSCAARLRLRREGMVLLAVIPHAGPPPDCADLIGVEFPSLRAPRDAVVARMKSTEQPK